MSEFVDRVAKALRENDEAELGALKREAGAMDRTDPQVCSDVLDCRELNWFKIERGWVPPEGVDIDQWLGDMREKDQELCDQGHFHAGHLEECWALREAVDQINDLRRSQGLEPLTEEQAMK